MPVSTSPSIAAQGDENAIPELGSSLSWIMLKNINNGLDGEDFQGKCDNQRKKKKNSASI